MSEQDDWDKQIERIDERTAKRRAKIKQLDEEMRNAIQEADQRRAGKEPAGESEDPEE